MVVVFTQLEGHLAVVPMMYHTCVAAGSRYAMASASGRVTISAADSAADTNERADEGDEGIADASGDDGRRKRRCQRG